MNKYLPFVMIASLAACGGSGGGGGTPASDPVQPDPIVDDPIADLEEGESDIRNPIVVETSGGRYELTAGSLADTAGSIAGETVHRINVARGPNRPNGGGFGTALEFEGAAVDVFAGTDTGQQPNFAAVGGTTVAPTGNATFTGHYSVADDPAVNALQTDFEHGALTLNLDFAAGTLSGTSDNSVLVVNATVDGGELDGSVTVSGSSADIVTGGFFGTDAAEVAGGFVNSDFGGYFYGN